jgi:hypothetical protein
MISIERPHLGSDTSKFPPLIMHKLSPRSLKANRFGPKFMARCRDLGSANRAGIRAFRHLSHRSVGRYQRPDVFAPFCCSSSGMLGQALIVRRRRAASSPERGSRHMLGHDTRFFGELAPVFRGRRAALRHGRIGIRPAAVLLGQLALSFEPCMLCSAKAGRRLLDIVSTVAGRARTLASYDPPGFPSRRRSRLRDAHEKRRTINRTPAGKLRPEQGRSDPARPPGSYKGHQR